MSFEAPARLDQALSLLAQSPRPTILAGGTDLWPQWTGGAPRPERLLSLHRISELRRLELEDRDATLRIGATCTHRDLVRSELVQRHCPSLSQAAATIGAVQIQNRGTVGGNIINGSPAADLPPPLLAADAEVELASAARGVRRLPLERLLVSYRTLDRAPDELLVAVRVPVLPPGSRELFRKVGTRRAQAISKVVGACRATVSTGAIQSIAVAFGSIGPISVRLRAVETWLVGRTLDRETVQEAERRAAEAVTPIDDLRSSAPYRRHVTGSLLRMWLEALARA